MEDRKYHTPLQDDDDDGPTVWRSFWLVFLVPIIIAFINPATGVYIVDVLALAVPMIVALALLFLFLTTIRELLVKYLDENIHSTRIFVVAFLIGSFTLSISAGFVIGDVLRVAALKHFGEAQADVQKADRHY
ncbi:MAG: hypothetical protein AB7P23_05510 [Amphiplicatus sp.]